MAKPIVEQVADAIIAAIDGKACTGTGQAFTAGMPGGIVDWMDPPFAESDVVLQISENDITDETLPSTPDRDSEAVFQLYPVTYGLPGISPERVIMRYVESVRKLLWDSGELGGTVESLTCPKVKFAAAPGCLIAEIDVHVTFHTTGDGYTQT